MGRPLRLDKQRQQRICEALRAGNTRAASAAYGGVGESTFYRWMERGEAASSGIYRDFWEAVKEAEAACEIRNVALIQKAAQDNWTAAAWWLERRKPDDWARVERQRHEGPSGGPMRVEVKVATPPEDVDSWARAVAAKLAEVGALAGDDGEGE